VRGGDESDVEAHGLDAPDAVHGPRLQRAQEPGLKARGKLADLVEKHGALRGDLEQPRLGPAGPGEGPALVAEQLALEQWLAQAGAIDGHELPAAPGQLVERPRENVLADAGLPGDEDADHPSSHARDHVRDAGRRRVGDGEGGAKRHAVLDVTSGLDDDGHVGAELEVPAHVQRRAAALADPLARDAGAVGAAQVLDLDGVAGVNERVPARDLG